jgi:hypothetical protein
MEQVQQTTPASPPPATIDTVTPPPPTYADIDVAGASPTVDPTVAARRAGKVKFGLSLDKPYEEIMQGIIAGKENEYRQQAAADRYFQIQNLKHNLIVQAAKDKGGSLNSMDLDFINNRVNSMTVDPQTIFEKNYADEYMKYLDLTQPKPDNPTMSWVDSVVGRATQDQPKQTEETMQLGKTLLARNQIVTTMLEDKSREVENQPTFQWLKDTAKRLVPGYEDVQLRGHTQSSALAGVFLGNALEQQAIDLLRIPSDKEFETKLKAITDTLTPMMAVRFLDAVRGQSTSDRVLNNAMPIIDVLSIPFAGSLTKSALTKIGLFNETRQAAKDMVKSIRGTVGPNGESAKVMQASGAGDAAEAGIQKATQEVVEDMAGKGNPTTRALQDLPSALVKDTVEIDGNPGHLGREIANRIREMYSNLQTNLMDSIVNRMKVGRIDAVKATEETMRAYRDAAMDRYPGWRNAIVNIDHYYEPVSSTDWWKYKIGRATGEGFTNEKTARISARMHDLVDATQVQEGGMWFNQVYKPWNETDWIIRDGLLESKAARAPDSWVNAAIGWLRNPQDVQSMDARMNRSIAVYGPSNFLKIAKENLQEVEKLSKWAFPFTKKREKWNDWSRIVKAADDMTDPDTGKKGYFFKSPGELDHHYDQLIGRLPDEQETVAYFAFKANMEMDRMLRNVAEVRNRARLGVESHQFYTFDKDGNKVNSGFIDGALQNVFPGGKDDKILLMGDELGKERVITVSRLDAKTHAKYVEDVTHGRLKVVELYQPEHRPLSEFGTKVGDQRIRYVVSNKIETKQLNWDIIPRRGGSHHEYDYDHYIKQADIRKDGDIHWYEGDNNLMAAKNRAMGSKFSSQINDVVKLMREGQMDAAEALAKNTLPWEWKEFSGWFKPSKVNGKNVPARFNLLEPFQVTPRNTLIHDIDNSLASRYPDTFRDGTRQGSLARQFQVEFSQARDAFEMYGLKDTGTRDRPVYSLEPAARVDPIASMNRAMARITNTTYSDDYKIFAIEHWLRAAAPYLKTQSGTDAELRYAPFAYFARPEYRIGADILKVNQLKAQRMQIQQFLGVKNSVDTFLTSAAQKLSDAIYTAGGATALRLDPSWALPYIKDPFKFIRSVTYHFKLGLFNPVQLFVQSQTYVTMLGIAGPRYAATGTYAALLHQWYRINPAMLDTLDRYASKLQIGGVGWKPGELKESIKLGEQTGFFNVGGEYAVLDDLAPKTIRTATGTVLDAGLTFFKGAEKNVRLGAWHVAYREFRDKFGNIRAITDKDKAWILDRADLQYTNMSRASSSILQSGVLSFPTQFLSYQIRLAELMTGKRLTTLEKGRLFTTYAAMYGIPSAVGIAGFPIGDYVRKTAQENGYVVGDNFIKSLVMEGGPAMIGALTTGTVFNVGERYAVQGIEPIRELLHGDEAFWKILGGASISTLAETFQSLGPFEKAMMSWMRDDKQYFPLQSQDFIEPFLGVSTVANFKKLYFALNYAKWVSKNESYLDDVTKGNAIFQFLTGLSPQQQSDVFTKQWTRREEKDVQSAAMKDAIKEFQRGMRADVDGNKGQARDFFQRAFAILVIAGYPEEEKAKFLSIASKSDRDSLRSKVDWDYYNIKVPETRKPGTQDALARTLRLQP